MTPEVDPETGEVRPVELVPLDIGTVDEHMLVQGMPTPQQAAAALIRAREVLRRAPAALDTARQELKGAERDHRVELAKATIRALDEYPDLSVTERKTLAHADARVIEAQERLDIAWLALEYARDWERALGRDIELLRSLNANLRGEHR